jgi:hypothetical protein
MQSIATAIRSTFISGYDKLIQGGDFGESKLTEWFGDGRILGFHGFDMPRLIRLMTIQINSVMLNALMTNQRIVILGGMKCNEDTGVGQGPLEGWHCYKGRSWFLMNIVADKFGGHFWSDERWGAVGPIPGHDKLGKGSFAGITHAVCWHSYF